MTDDNIVSTAVGRTGGCESVSTFTSTFTFSSVPAASTTKKGKRKTGRCLIPDQESEAENQLFSKLLQSEIKKNDAITEAETNALELEIEQLGLVIKC